MDDYLPRLLVGLFGFYLLLEGVGDILESASLAFWPLPGAEVRSILIRGLVLLAAGTLVVRRVINLVPPPTERNREAAA